MLDKCVCVCMCAHMCVHTCICMIFENFQVNWQTKTHQVSQHTLCLNSSNCHSYVPKKGNCHFCFKMTFKKCKFQATGSQKPHSWFSSRKIVLYRYSETFKIWSYPDSIVINSKKQSHISTHMFCAMENRFWKI